MAKKKAKAKVKGIQRKIVKKIIIPSEIITIPSEIITIPPEILLPPQQIVNPFVENKIYHFNKQGQLIPDKEATAESTKMVKLIPIKKEDADIIFRKMNDQNATTKTENRVSKFIQFVWDEKKYDCCGGIFKPFFKMLRRTFSGYEDFGRNSTYLHRHNRIHLIAKNWLFKPGLRIMKKVVGRYAITKIEDIPEKKYNNHQRIFYYCWQEALLDTFVGPNWEAERRGEARAFKDKEEYVKWLKETKFWSWDNRSSVINLWMTEITEDTFDREWENYFMLRMYHEIHELYGGNVPRPEDFPHYTGIAADNPVYFARFAEHPMWKPSIKSWEQRVKEWELRKIGRQQ